MLSFTYERRFESHPLYEQLWAVRKAIRDIYASRNGSTDSRHQKIVRLKDRATDLEYTINQALFADAKVFACTLTGSANHLLDGMKFGTLFIDEAAQALEAATWIAIQKAHRVILAGDHRQLPPTIKSPEAMHGGLDRTLMQAIVEQKPQVVSLLTVQYRMADGIMQFPNREFYDGQLESAPNVKYRGILDWDTAMDWVDTEEHVIVLEARNEELPLYGGIAPAARNTDSLSANDSNSNSSLRTNGAILSRSGNSATGSCNSHLPFKGEEASGLSKVNPAEARLTLDTLQAYFEKIGKDRILEERIDVGIISPYKAQVNLLRHLLKCDRYWKPFRSLITINSVDGFQGQERDIIVISLVRHNDEGNIGFLRDLRRMNVAITRARMKLILIGHKPTLCRMPFYKRLAKYVDELTY